MDETRTIASETREVCFLPPADGRHGWRLLERPGVELWLKGYIYSHSDDQIADRLATADWGREALAEMLNDLDGHYALFSRRNGQLLAAVDKVRSIPVVYGLAGDRVVSLGAQGRTLAGQSGLDVNAIDPVAALSIALSGYTIGADSIYSNLKVLRPGEFIHIGQSEAGQVHRYHRYQPWRAAAEPRADEAQRLADVTLGILEKLLRSADGREIVIPLSAGYDSRVIASGLKELGARNVKCFSYGVDGNFEARASEVIASKLGYEWCFVPTRTEAMRKLYRSDFTAEFAAFADDGASVMMVQDLGVMQHLLEAGWLDRHSIVVNGNSGDFISGNHIPAVLAGGEIAGEIDLSARQDIILQALWAKHYQLWGSLQTPENREMILARLHRELLELPMPERRQDDFGLYEFLEFQDRQSKYVIAGQRAYEFLDMEWRLPLWDVDYLDYWEGVPKADRIGQTLYRRVMRDCNWGGVWDIWPLNSKSIKPSWLRPARLACKLAMAPFGKAAWHRLERNLFTYWMDNIGSYQMFPYGKVATDRRGQRHAVSWLAADYLANKGLGYDGRPMKGPRNGA